MKLNKSKLAITAILASAVISCAPINANINLINERNIVVSDLTDIVYKLTKEEGMQQLNKLALDNKYEDSWYFIPETNEWIDNGYKLGRYEFSVKEDTIPKMRPNVKEVCNYHIHPAQTFWFIEGRPDGVSNEEVKNFYGLTPPSVEDVTYWLDNKEYLKKHGISLVESGVVDCRGYWRINLEKSDLENFRSSLDAYEKMVDKYIDTYFEEYKKHKNDKVSMESIKQKVIDNFEVEAAKLGLNIEYVFLK